MGCNNSKTKKADKRKKEEAEAVAAAANAGSGGGASARDEARASESADAPAVAAAVPAAAAPSPLEGRQSADAAKGAAVDSADAADAEAAATSTSTAAESSSAVGADGELPESPADLSDTVIAEAHLADADEAPAAAAAAADAAVAAEPSRHASTPPATATDDVKEGHTTALYSSVSRTEPSPPPPALQRDEATADSDVHFEMEDLDDDDAAAAAGVAAQEVPPSQLRSTPRSPSPAPQPSPPPPAATPSEQETAATPVAMESAPQPTPKRDGSQPEATKRQRGSVAAASSTAASPHHRAPRAERLAALAASTRRRLSRRTSTAASSSLAERPPWRDAVSEESAAAPVEHPPSHQRGPAAPPAAAHRPPRFWSDDDVAVAAVAAAAAALSPTASSAAASSEAPVMHEAVMPVGTPSERVAARRRRADLDRDVYTQPPAVELVRYRDSLGTIRTPRSQPPSLPASQPRRRGPAVSIPLRRGYTDPTPGAAAHEYRPTTTYLPPPTAFNKEAAGGAPPRLSLHPGVIAAIEASTTALVQAHRLPPHPAASGPVAGRLPASAADVAAYRDAVPLPPSHLCDGVYTATSIALATTESCSSHRSASDRLSPAAAAADQQPRHHDADAVSAGATREAGTYEPQYSNAHEPREGSVGAYEPSATDEAPTNSAVLPPVARRAGSGSADPRYPTSDDDVVEAWRHDAVDVTGGAAPALVDGVSPSQLHRRVQSWSPAEGSDGGDGGDN